MRRASSRRWRCGFPNEAKSKARVGRPLHRYHAASLIILDIQDPNIQDPIARRPSGKRAKVRHRPCRHRYAVFNLDLRFAGQPPRHLRTSSSVLGVYLIVRFSFPWSTDWIKAFVTARPTWRRRALSRSSPPLALAVVFAKDRQPFIFFFLHDQPSLMLQRRNTPRLQLVAQGLGARNFPRAIYSLTREYGSRFSQNLRRGYCVRASKRFWGTPPV